MIRISITPELATALAYVHHFSSKIDIRYYITGVCIQNDSSGCNIVATNGKILSVASTKLVGVDGFEIKEKFETIVPIEAMANFVKKMRPDRSFIDIDGNKITLCPDLSTTTSVFANEGRFPDWRRVMPREDRTIQVTDLVGFMVADLGVLEKAYKSASKFKKNDKPFFAFRFGGNRESILITPYAFPNIKTVVSPVTI